VRRFKSIELYVPGGEAVEHTARRAVQEALNNPDVEIVFTHNGGTVKTSDSEITKPLLAAWDESRRNR
jgi:hypothetical protein